MEVSEGLDLKIKDVKDVKVVKKESKYKHFKVGFVFDCLETKCKINQRRN